MKYEKVVTNIRSQTSHKFPDMFEIWHSYDGGKCWTFIGMTPKTKREE